MLAHVKEVSKAFEMNEISVAKKLGTGSKNLPPRVLTNLYKFENNGFPFIDVTFPPILESFYGPSSSLTLKNSVLAPYTSVVLSSVQVVWMRMLNEFFGVGESQQLLVLGRRGEGLRVTCV